MAMSLVLESFGEDAPVEFEKSADYQDGYESGRADLQAELDAMNDRALTDVAQTMADIEFGYVEARQAVLAALGPLMAAIVDSLLPTLSAEALKPQLTQAIAEAAERATTTGIAVALSPKDAEHLEGLSLDQTVQITTDRTLRAGTARIAAGFTEHFLDLPATQDAIRRALRNLTDIDERSAHG